MTVFGSQHQERISASSCALLRVLRRHHRLMSLLKDLEERCVSRAPGQERSHEQDRGGPPLATRPTSSTPTSSRCSCRSRRSTARAAGCPARSSRTRAAASKGTGRRAGWSTGGPSMSPQAVRCVSSHHHRSPPLPLIIAHHHHCSPRHCHCTHRQEQRLEVGVL